MPSCEHKTSYLFIIRLKDNWFVSTFHLWSMLGTLAHKILCGHMFSILLVIHVGIELMDHMVIPKIISWTIKLFSREAAPLHFSTSYIWELSFVYNLANTCYGSPVFLLLFYYLWWNIVFPGPAVLLHNLLHLPRMHSPNHSLTGPFLRVVLVVSNREGWGSFPLKNEQACSL